MTSEMTIAGSSQSEPAMAGASCIAALAHELQHKRRQGLARTRRTVESMQGVRVRVDGREVVAFASNDYLGLAADPAVITAMQEGAARWGAGAGASHLVSGHFAPHRELEDELARYARPCVGAAAVLFATGYLANLAVVSTLAERTDAVFADRLNHASLNDGALLSRAAFVRYGHLDVDALRSRVAASQARRRIIVTDAVFSMDGDVAPIAQLARVAEEFDAMLVVDDAHGFGVLGGGRGTMAEAGVSSERVVLMGTLGKAAGVAGAFVCAHPVVIETLVQTARPYVYTTASPPALAVALREALARIRDGAVLRGRVFANVARLRAALVGLPWRLSESRTPIQPLIVGDNGATLALSRELWERGFWVPAIRPPTVPAGTARLRISLSAAHEATDIDALAAALHDLARRAR